MVLVLNTFTTLGIKYLPQNVLLEMIPLWWLILLMPAYVHPAVIDMAPGADDDFFVAGDDRPVAGDRHFVENNDSPIAGDSHFVENGDPPVSGDSHFVENGDPPVLGDSLFAGQL